MKKMVKKTIIVTLSLGFLVAFGFGMFWLGANYRTNEITQKDESTVTETVYITKTGSKYHREGCRHLSKSKIPISLKKAEHFYRPCKVCRPPQKKM